MAETRSFCLEVRGDLACFTRPEFKVERVSYEVITPSAARAVFEAILWKPAIAWRIERIEVLNPVRWLTVRRNEVAGKVPTASVQATMRQGTGSLGLYIEDDRQQRASLVLRDVAYRLHGRFAMTERAQPGDSVVKFAEMFTRRAGRGQCINQPYLGCREFACRFRLVEEPATEVPPLGETRDLGVMLYDLDFTEPSRPRPLFFRPRLSAGVIDVPPRESGEVLA